MTLQRRSFLGAMLAAGVAPAIARSGVLMPVRRLVPGSTLIEAPPWIGNGAVMCSRILTLNANGLVIFDALGRERVRLGVL